MPINKLADFEMRLGVIEQSYKSLADEFRAFCEASGEKHQTLTDAFDAFKNDIGEKLDTITVFVSGANTIFGLARKHWRRVFIFGAGVMTSAGFGNPKVWAFLSSFAGG
jgi:type IV secretory pathway VirB2 component (pilin)